MKHSKRAMKNKIISIILITVICSLVFISMQGCFMWNSCTNLNSESEEGISVGFRYDKERGSYFTALKSPKDQFNIDDVTLDFYFGAKDTVYENSCEIALAFLNPFDSWDYEYQTKVDDYNKIENLFIIDQKTPKEIINGPYDINIKWGYNFYFHFKTTWTIPKEVFTEERGRLRFLMAYAVKDQDEPEKYNMVYEIGSSIIIEYIKTDDNAIQLTAEEA